MGKKILDSKLLYAILAIIISVVLWFYVAITENRDAELTIRDIPVVFLNSDMLEDNSLMISDGEQQTVSLTFMGSRSLLTDLNQRQSELWVTVDVGRITASGEQRMAYDISYPGTNSRFSNGLSIIEREPNNIYFTVAECTSKTIDVVGKFVGSLAEDYMAGTFSIRPETIEISGLASDVNQVSYAQVKVGGDQLSTTFTGEMVFNLIGFQGEELTGLNVTCSEETVLVTMPVVKTAEVPLAVKLVPGGGVTDPEQYVNCDISPKRITVSGAEVDLEPLKEILLGEIDLANLIGSDTFEFDIPLDSALENVTGVTRATVTVSISGLETKVLDVDNIELINKPDGFEAEKVTQSLQVLVRGPEDEINLVQPYHLRVVADLSEVGNAVGRYTVPVRVYLDGTNDVGVINGDYKIVVSIFDSEE